MKATGLVLEDNTDVVDAPSGGKVLKTFMKGDILEVTGETGNFYEVSVGGQTGFVDHSRVDLPASPFARHRPTGPYRGISKNLRPLFKKAGWKKGNRRGLPRPGARVQRVTAWKATGAYQARRHRSALVKRSLGPGQGFVELRA